MLKKEINHKNWDGEDVTTVAHFHITKSTLVENIQVVDELDAMEAMLEGGERNLTPTEIKKIVDLVKFFMRLAYGVREGDRFVQNEELWTNFTQTAAYDQLFYSMFDQPEEAVEFLFTLLPDDIRAQAEEARSGVKAPKKPTDRQKPAKK